MDKIEHEMCPFCRTENLTLTEEEIEIPYFGKTYIFSMSCSNCKYSKSDVEAEESKEPCRITFTVEGEEDLKVRVVKSSEATVLVPQMKMSMTPGPSSIGFISNVEGLIVKIKEQVETIRDKFKVIIEQERDSSDEDDVRAKAKSLLKKIWKVKCGDVPLKIVIEDPSGNSAIISEKAEVKKLK